MDPSLTDEEIIATFTPLEHQFYEWQILGKKEARRLGESIRNGDQFYKRLQEKFPLPDIKKKYRHFVDKWQGRVLRRLRQGITAEAFFERLRNTDCKNGNSLSHTSLWMHFNRFADLYFGKSSFGGSVMHYASVINPITLVPDALNDKRVDPPNPNLLYGTVLAIDIDIDEICLPALALQQTPDSPQALKRRRRESSSSGEDSTISVRSANSEDFLDKKPFVFFQIGALCCCTSKEWKRHVVGLADEPYDPEFQMTDYSVVVRLDSNGFPTDGVYIIYNYQEETTPEESNGPGDPASWKEREWRDKHNVELPHIRRLYPGCDMKFFLAKIAENLTDLKKDGQFDIQVIIEERKTIVRAKTAGVMQNIIPSEIVAEVRPAEEYKRACHET
ncbi:MAG: hypothetical protein SEPTF4163_004141 [Sporothrix epigloea]